MSGTVPFCADACLDRPRLRHFSLAGLVILFLVSGCATGVVYNRMDWLVSWYVNGLVSLDKSQETALRQVVHKTMAWHRQTQLPRYVGMLEEMSRQAGGPVTAAQLEDRYQQVSGYLDEFMRHVIPDAAPLLLSLRPEQRDELRESLEEGNQELWKDYAGESPEERRAQRKKSALRMIQRFVGRLSRDQRDLVGTRLAGMRDVSGEWIERRRLWQQSFLGLLGQPGPPSKFTAGLEHLALDPNQFDTPGYRLEVEKNRRIVMEMLAEISDGLSGRQREHLRRKFLELAGDLEKISESG